MAYNIHRALGATTQARAVFRRDVAWTQLAVACGALDGARVGFSARHNWLWADVQHPDILIQQRSFRRDASGALYIYNHEFTKRPGTSAGLGLRVVAQQVQAAELLGCQRIEMWAAGDARSVSRNGYYTWAVLGFDGPLTLQEQGRLPEYLYGAHDQRTHLAWRGAMVENAR